MKAIIVTVITVTQYLYPESRAANNMVSKILLLGESSSQRQSSSGLGEPAVDDKARCRVGWEREESSSPLVHQLLTAEPETPFRVSSAHMSRFSLLEGKN